MRDENATPLLPEGVENAAVLRFLGIGLLSLATLGTAPFPVVGRAAMQGTAAPPTVSSRPPQTWAEEGAAHQERIVLAGEDVPLRYRVRKVDGRGDVTREVIESRDGAVARLVQRNGRPLIPAEDAAERERLEAILSHPEAWAKRHRREQAGREYALKLIRALPGAMIWSYVAGQPQLPEAHGPQIVLDFAPDPRFKPPTLITEGLSGIAGRVWLDAASRCVLRIDGRIVHPVDFGWGGMLARVSEGGTVQLDQAQVAEHRWFYTHMSEHVTVREMLVHTVNEQGESRAWDPKMLPAPLSGEQAVRELLAMPVPTR